MRLVFGIVGLLLGGAAQAQDLRYSFEWVGGGDYVMRGAFAYDPSLAGRRVIRETDLSCFEIAGFEGDQQVGRFALRMLTPDTTWVLSFDSVMQEFIVYGAGAAMPQAWNMDGAGFNCGSPGFGFNIGNAAQDLCVNGQLIFESQVEPSRPFPVERNEAHQFSPDACKPELLLGSLLKGG